MSKKESNSIEDSEGFLADYPIVNIYKNYINSNHLKLQASGNVYFAQRFLLHTPPNYEEAIKMWRIALISSNSTNSIAIYNLGVHYYLGKGLKQNFKKACDLFEKAAHFNNFLYGCRNFGVQESCFAIGKCYEDGTGRCRDLEQAEKWYSKSQRCNCGCYPAEGTLAPATKQDIVRELHTINFLIYFGNTDIRMCRENDPESVKYWEHENEIKLKAEKIKNGYSADLRKAMDVFAQATYAMSSYFADDPKVAHREQIDIVQQEIIHLVASSARFSPEDLSFSSMKMWTKFTEFLDSNIRESLGDKSSLDRDARICKLLDMQRITPLPEEGQKHADKMLQFVKQSISKYPNEVLFQHASICVASLDEQTLGPKAGFNLQLAYQTFPSNTFILFYRAKLIGTRHVLQLKKETAYWDFIDMAPQDHKHLPEAFYELAKLEGEFDNLQLSLIYYNQGVEAEKNMLSFSLPYKSETKDAVEKMFESLK